MRSLVERRRGTCVPSVCDGGESAGSVGTGELGDDIGAGSTVVGGGTVSSGRDTISKSPCFGL